MRRCGVTFASNMERAICRNVRISIRNPAVELNECSLLLVPHRVAPRNGMSTFIDAIVKELPRVGLYLNAPIERLSQLPDSHQWCLNVGGAERRRITTDAIVLATPAHHAARLLRSVDPHLASDLARIEYASSTLITLGYRREQIDHPLNGFGFVVPLAECLRILSASFTSVKYPGRAPHGTVSIRIYMGGACQPKLLELDDDSLLSIAEQELTELLGITGAPQLRHICRHVRAMPQYQVGHISLVERITNRANKLRGFTLAGNSLYGVGVPHCIRTAEAAARRLCRALTM